MLVITAKRDGNKIYPPHEIKAIGTTDEKKTIEFVARILLEEMIASGIIKN